MPEAIAIAIDHQHTEEFIVYVALDQSGSAGQDLLQVKRGIHFLADFRESGEHLGGHLFRQRSGTRLGFRVRGVHELIYYSRHPGGDFPQS